MNQLPDKIKIDIDGGIRRESQCDPSLHKCERALSNRAAVTALLSSHPEMEVGFEPLPFVRCLANHLVHMMVAVNVFVVLEYSVLFLTTNYQLHVTFSVIGYQLLMMEAILTFDPNNGWTNQFPRGVKSKIHIVLQILGSIFVIAGFSIIVHEKSSVGFSHFKSAHAICGLIGFIFSMCSLIVGTLMLVSPERMRIRRTPVKFLHAVSGCFAIIMGLVTLCIGVNMDIFTLLRGKNVSVCVTVFTSLSLAYTLISPMFSTKTYLQNMTTTAL